MNKNFEKALRQAGIYYCVYDKGIVYGNENCKKAGDVIISLVQERDQYKDEVQELKNKCYSFPHGKAVNKDKSGSSTAAKHYQLEIQPITVMQADMSKERFCGYLQGNVLKYVLRYMHKGGNEDLGKAMQYLYWLKLVELGKKIDPMKDTVELKER